jgi:putative hydrolase of the HAD superfamily
MGLKTAVMSDFPIGEKLKYFGMEDIWDVKISSEESGYLKPDRRPFLLLSARLGMKPEEIIYVGNSYTYDVLGSKNVGMIAGHLSSSAKDGSIADFNPGIL